MSKRTCDACGKERELAGGKTCSNGHFICKDCYWSTGGFFTNPKKGCPLCHKELR